MTSKMRTGSTEVAGRVCAAADVGKRVVVQGYPGAKGKLAFYGPVTSKGVTTDRCGVVMDDPVGKNDGELRGVRYFKCNPKHGLFLAADSGRVTMARRSSQSGQSGAAAAASPRASAKLSAKPRRSSQTVPSEDGHTRTSADIGKQAIVDECPVKGDAHDYENVESVPGNDCFGFDNELTVPSATAKNRDDHSNAECKMYAPLASMLAELHIPQATINILAAKGVKDTNALRLYSLDELKAVGVKGRHAKKLLERCSLSEPAPEPEPESEPKPEPETKPAKVAAADDAGSAMTKKQLLDHLTAFYDTHAPGTKTASALSKAAKKYAGKDLVKLDAPLKKKFGETLTEFIGKCTIVWDASTAVPVPDPKSESTSELEPEPEGFIEVEENAGFGDFEGIADLAKLEDIGTGAGGEIEAAPAAVENEVDFGFPDSDSESGDSPYAEAAKKAAKKAADRAKEAAEKERLRLLKIATFPPGSRVLVAGFPGAGVVRYYGEPDGANKPNECQYGVELELPEGKNKGNQLFLCTVCPASCGQPWPRNSGGACKAKHGVLVAPDKVSAGPPAVPCSYTSTKGKACKLVALADATCCLMHTCSKEGCTKKKASKNEFCRDHTDDEPAEAAPSSPGLAGMESPARLGWQGSVTAITESNAAKKARRKSAATANVQDKAKSVQDKITAMTKKEIKHRLARQEVLKAKMAEDKDLVVQMSVKKAAQKKKDEDKDKADKNKADKQKKAKAAAAQKKKDEEKKEQADREAAEKEEKAAKNMAKAFKSFNKARQRVTIFVDEAQLMPDEAAVVKMTTLSLINAQIKAIKRMLQNLPDEVTFVDEVLCAYSAVAGTKKESKLNEDDAKEAASLIGACRSSLSGAKKDAQKVKKTLNARRQKLRFLKAFEDEVVKFSVMLQHVRGVITGAEAVMAKDLDLAAIKADDADIITEGVAFQTLMKMAVPRISLQALVKDVASLKALQTPIEAMVYPAKGDTKEWTFKRNASHACPVRGFDSVSNTLLEKIRKLVPKLDGREKTILREYQRPKDIKKQYEQHVKVELGSDNEAGKRDNRAEAEKMLLQAQTKADGFRSWLEGTEKTLSAAKPGGNVSISDMAGNSCAQRLLMHKAVVAAVAGVDKRETGVDGEETKDGDAIEDGTGQLCKRILLTELVGGEFVSRVWTLRETLAMAERKLNDTEQRVTFVDTVRVRSEQHQELCDELVKWLDATTMDTTDVPHSRSSVETNWEISQLDSLKVEANMRLFGKELFQQDLDVIMFTMDGTPDAPERFWNPKTNVVSDDNSGVAPAPKTPAPRPIRAQDDDDPAYAYDSGITFLKEDVWGNYPINVHIGTLTDPELHRVSVGAMIGKSGKANIELGDYVTVIKVGAEAFMAAAEEAKEKKKTKEDWDENQRHAFRDRTEVGMVVAVPPDSHVSDGLVKGSMDNDQRANPVYTVRFSKSKEIDNHVQAARITKMAAPVCASSSLCKTHRKYPAIHHRGKDGTIMSALAWAEHTLSNKINESAEMKNRKADRTRLPIKVLGEYLSTAVYKSELSEWTQTDHAATKMTSDVEEIFTAWCEMYDARKMALTRQLKTVTATEMTYGRTLRHVWGEPGSWDGITLSFNPGGYPTVFSIEQPANQQRDAVDGLAELQAVSRVNSIPVGWQNVKNLQDLAMQFKQGTAENDKVLYTVQTHTTALFNIEVNKDAEAKKGVGLTGLVVRAKDGFLRVVDILPGFPVEKLDLEIGDIISAVNAEGGIPDRFPGAPSAKGKTAKDMSKRIKEAKPGTTIKIVAHANRFDITIPAPRKMAVKKRMNKRSSVKGAQRRASVSDKKGKRGSMKMGRKSSVKKGKADQSEATAPEPKPADAKIGGAGEETEMKMTFGFDLFQDQPGDPFYIVDILRDGPACHAGLREGDYVTNLDGCRLRGSSINEVRTLLNSSGSLELAVSRPTAEQPPKSEHSKRPHKSANDATSVRKVMFDLLRAFKPDDVIRFASGVPARYMKAIVPVADGCNAIDYKASFAVMREKTDLTTLLKQLIKVGMDVKTSSDGSKAALRTIQQELGNEEKLPSNMINESTRQGETAISIAAKFGAAAVINLIARRANTDMNATNTAGETPLMVAISAGQADAVKALLENGANPNIMALNGELAIERAINKATVHGSSLLIVQLLLHTGACSQERLKPDGSRSSLVELALNLVAKVASPLVDLLVQYGADLNLRASDGRSMLRIAIEKFKKAPEIAARIILNDGPNPLAIDKGIVEVLPNVRDMAPVQQNMDHKYTMLDEEIVMDGVKTTAMIQMVGHKQGPAVRKMIEYNVRGLRSNRYEIPTSILPENSRYRQPCSSFELAVLTGSAEITGIFIEQDPAIYLSILQKPAGYQFSTQNFAQGWDLFAIPKEKMAYAGGDPRNAGRDTGQKYVRPEELLVSGLVAANHEEAVQWVELIKKHKIDPNVRRSYGCALTAVLIALGHTKAAMELLKSEDIKLDVTDDKGRSLLFYASYSQRDDRSEVLQYLLENGADPLRCGADNTSPLLAAARNNDMRSFLMFRNIDFKPYQKSRLVKVDDPRPWGQAIVEPEVVGLDGLSIYSEPDFKSDKVAVITGQVKAVAQTKKRGIFGRKAIAKIDTKKDGSAAQDYAIKGSITIAVVRDGSNMSVNIVQCDDLQGVARDEETKLRIESSTAHCELVLASRTEKRVVKSGKSFFHKTKMVEDSLDPEFSSKGDAPFVIPPTDTKADASVGGNINFSASFNARAEELTVTVVSATDLGCGQFKQARVEVQLLQADGFELEDYEVDGIKVSFKQESESVKTKDPTKVELSKVFKFKAKEATVRSRILKMTLKSPTTTSSTTLGVCMATTHSVLPQTWGKLKRLVKGRSLRTMFEDLDADNSGTITGAELRKALEDVGMKVSDEEVNQMVTAKKDTGLANLDYASSFQVPTTCSWTNDKGAACQKRTDGVGFCSRHLCKECKRNGMSSTATECESCKASTGNFAIDIDEFTDIMTGGVNNSSKVHSSKLQHMLWGLDPAIIEVWHGKRGKDGSFLGQVMFDLEGAAAATKAAEGKCIVLPLKGLTHTDVTYATTVVKLREFEPVPIIHPKDVIGVTDADANKLESAGWFKLHQSNFNDLVETYSAEPHDAYSKGWVNIKDKASGGVDVVQVRKGSDKEKAKLAGLCRPHRLFKKKHTFCVLSEYKKDPAYTGVSGEPLNIQDGLGNTALWYAVLHENFDMVRSLLLDPDVDVNMPCGEGFTPFMMSTVIKPRGNLEIFYAFLHADALGTNKLKLKNTENMSMKTSLTLDKGGKANNVADYALMEEFVYHERPMTNELAKRGCFPTKQVAQLLEYEGKIEQDRLQAYRIKDVPWISEEKEYKVAGSMTVNLVYDNALFDGFGGLKVTVVKAEGIALVEEKVTQKKDKETGEMYEDTSKWSNSYCNVILIHNDESNRRDGYVQKTQTRKESDDTPTWGKTFRFELQREKLKNKSITVECWSRSGNLLGGRSKFLGMATFNVGDVSDTADRTQDLIELDNIPDALEAAAPAWKNAILEGRTDGPIKKSWESIIKDECAPFTTQALHKARCMYDTDALEELKAIRSKQIKHSREKRGSKIGMAIAVGAGMAVGVGTSTALLLTAAKMQKRKYDESKIHSQHTNHNYFAKLFESDKKRFCGPQYFHIAKDTWMRRRYDPRDSGAKNFSLGRNQDVNFDNDGTEQKLLDHQAEVFLFDMDTARKATVGDVAQVRKWTDSLEGKKPMKRMFDALKDVRVEDIAEEEEEDGDEDYGFDDDETSDDE